MPEIPVEPLAGAPAAAPQAPPSAPAPVDQGQTTPEAEGPELPPALLEIPAIQATLAGAPPAFSMNIKASENRKEVKLLAENKDSMTEAGYFFYRSLDGKTGVIANALYIHPEDLQAADKAGKLKTVAPDFDVVNHEVAKMGSKHPAIGAKAPAGFAQPALKAPPQANAGSLPLVPPPPASVQNKAATARLLNLQTGAPTSGPAPGAGRLLNSVLKGVV